MREIATARAEPVEVEVAPASAQVVEFPQVQAKAPVKAEGSGEKQTAEKHDPVTRPVFPTFADETAVGRSAERVRRHLNHQNFPFNKQSDLRGGRSYFWTPGYKHPEFFEFIPGGGGTFRPFTQEQIKELEGYKAEQRAAGGKAQVKAPGGNAQEKAPAAKAK